jgi:hypothetical protein
LSVIKNVRKLVALRGEISVGNIVSLY